LENTDLKKSVREGRNIGACQRAWLSGGAQRMRRKGRDYRGGWKMDCG